MTATGDFEHPPWDDQIKGWVTARTEHWIVSVHPMLYNHRICLTSHEEYPHGYTAGFCYPSFLAAVAAAMVWDPEVEHAPVGYAKVACDSRPGSVASQR